MKQYIAQTAFTIISGAALAVTVWLGSTAVELSENSAAQTVLIQSVTNQVNALVLDVAVMESNLDEIEDFILLHPVGTHDNAATKQDVRDVIDAIADLASGTGT